VFPTAAAPARRIRRRVIAAQRRQTQARAASATDAAAELVTRSLA